jgi:hypothetical protein
MNEKTTSGGTSLRRVAPLAAVAAVLAIPAYAWTFNYSVSCPDGTHSEGSISCSDGQWAGAMCYCNNWDSGSYSDCHPYAFCC